MQLSRALSDLVKYTKSVGTHDVETEGEVRRWGGTLGRPAAGVHPRPGLTPAGLHTVVSSWQVSSFSETKAHQILQQKPEQYLRFNQHQLSRIYPSSYRVDSSNYNPQPFWNAGCQMGGWLAGQQGGACLARTIPAAQPPLIRGLGELPGLLLLPEWVPRGPPDLRQPGKTAGLPQLLGCAGLGQAWAPSASSRAPSHGREPQGLHTEGSGRRLGDTGMWTAADPEVLLSHPQLP